MKKYVVKQPATLKDFTDNTCAAASFCFRTLLKSREIRVNGIKIAADRMLDQGDEVCYYLTAAQERKTGYKILYEDDAVLVLDKESGVNSEAVYASLTERGSAYFIHRLDRNTEGLMIFAKTRQAESALKKAFRERKVEKIYHALVIGRPNPPRAVLQAFLFKDEQRASVTVSERSTPLAERIVTEYETVETRNDGTSLLKITLHTGKTHQIRAHMAFAGYPVVGDEKYGDHAFNRAAHVSRQKLIAKELRLTLPAPFDYLNDKKFISEKEL